MTEIVLDPPSWSQNFFGRVMEVSDARSISPTAMSLRATSTGAVAPERIGAKERVRSVWRSSGAIVVAMESEGYAASSVLRIMRHGIVWTS